MGLDTDCFISLNARSNVFYKMDLKIVDNLFVRMFIKLNDKFSAIYFADTIYMN